MFDGDWDLAEKYRNLDFKDLEEGHYWNYTTKKSYREGQVSIGSLKTQWYS